MIFKRKREKLTLAANSKENVRRYEGVNETRRMVRIESVLNDLNKAVSFLESVAVYSPEEAFERQSVHAAFEDIRTALMADDVHGYLSARRSIEILIREYGDEVFDLGNILERVTQELQDIGVDTAAIDIIDFNYQDLSHLIASEHPSFAHTSEEEGDSDKFLSTIKKLAGGKTAMRFSSIFAAAFITVSGAGFTAEYMRSKAPDYSVSEVSGSEDAPEASEFNLGPDRQKWIRILINHSDDGDWIRNNTNSLLKEWKSLRDNEQALILITIYDDQFIYSEAKEFINTIFTDFAEHYFQSKSDRKEGLNLLLDVAENFPSDVVRLLLREEMKPIHSVIDRQRFETLFDIFVHEEHSFYSWEYQGVLLRRMLMSIETFTDKDYFLYFQKFEDRFPGFSLAEILEGESEKIDELSVEKIVSIFDTGKWDSANPSVRLQVIHGVLNRASPDTLPDAVFIRFLREVVAYHFYPESEALFYSLFEVNPLLLIDDITWYGDDVPSRYFEEVLEHLSRDIFLECIDKLLYVFGKRDDLDADGVIERVCEEFPVADVILRTHVSYGHFRSVLSDSRRFSGFLQDPSFPLVESVNLDWIPERDLTGLDEFHRVSHRLMIARNLYSQGVSDPDSITEDMVEEASSSIMEARERSADITLFKDTHVSVCCRQ